MLQMKFSVQSIQLKNMNSQDMKKKLKESK